MYVGGAALKSECVYCIYAAIVLQAFVGLFRHGGWYWMEIGLGLRLELGFGLALGWFQIQNCHCQHYVSNFAHMLRPGGGVGAVGPSSGSA